MLTIESAIVQCDEASKRGPTNARGCNVKAYNRRLRDLIHQGKANPSIIISHELSLEEAPEAYAHFDKRDKGWTKVVLHPNAAKAV